MNEPNSCEDARLAMKALKDEVWDIAYLMRALGDPSRLSIVRLLKERKEMCVCELQQAMGCTRSALWHHLRVLREARIVRDRRKWRHVKCSLQPGEPEGFTRRFRILCGFPSANADPEIAAEEGTAGLDGELEP